MNLKIVFSWRNNIIYIDVMKRIKKRNIIIYIRLRKSGIVGKIKLDMWKIWKKLQIDWMNDGAAYGIDNMTYCEKGQYVKELFQYILIIQL